MGPCPIHTSGGASLATVEVGDIEPERAMFKASIAEAASGSCGLKVISTSTPERHLVYIAIPQAAPTQAQEAGSGDQWRTSSVWPDLQFRTTARDGSGGAAPRTAADLWVEWKSTTNLKGIRPNAAGPL